MPAGTRTTYGAFTPWYVVEAAHLPRKDRMARAVVRLLRGLLETRGWQYLRSEGHVRWRPPGGIRHGSGGDQRPGGGATAIPRARSHRTIGCPFGMGPLSTTEPHALSGAIGCPRPNVARRCGLASPRSV